MISKHLLLNPKCLLYGFCGLLGLLAVVLHESGSSPGPGLGLLLALFLPGFALTELRFSYRSSDIPLKWTEQFILSIFLSLIICILEGFLLDQTSLGLEPQSWIWLQSGIIVIMNLLLIGRLIIIRPAIGTIHIRFHPSPVQIVRAGSVFLILSGAFWVARFGALQPEKIGFSQLWMQPETDSDSFKVRLGIENFETGATTYDLRLTDGNQVLARWPSIQLTRKTNWETIIELPGHFETGSLEARLFKESELSSPYRYVKLHIVSDHE